MRIISKFFDYYDPIQRHGQDLTLIYNRIQTETGSKQRQWFPGQIATIEQRTFEDNGPKNTKLYSKLIRLGFCGQIYPVISIAQFNNGVPDRHYFYMLSELDEWFTDLSDCHIKDRYFDPKNKWGFSRVWCGEVFRDIPNQNWDDEFHKAKAPIILKQPWDYVCVNPKLADIEFYRIKDAYTAFQEIAGYLGGVLGGNNKPIPVPDDETMRDIKGFNERSFKKDPTTTKKRGKKR